MHIVQLVAEAEEWRREMKQRMVVTALSEREAGWSMELKTVGEDGIKDYRGFAVLPLTEEEVATIRVGSIIDVVGTVLAPEEASA